MARPGGGGRLWLPTTVKLKGLSFEPRTVIPGATAYAWGAMWTEFASKWLSFYKPQIDKIADSGSNCMRVTGSGDPGVNYPAPALFLAYVHQLLDYANSRGLYVYWQFTRVQGDGTNLRTAEGLLATLLPALEQHPNVIAVDLLNEVNLMSIGTDKFSRYLAIARQHSTLPVTASISCSGAGDITAAPAMAIAKQGADFMDYHAYFGGTKNTSSNATTASFDAYRATSWYKPWLIGEVGLSVLNSTAAQVQARWQAMATISEVAADCLGVLGFSAVDVSGSTDQFAMYAGDLSTSRSQVTKPFGNWKGRR